jgi:hypothetical protein
VRSKSVLLNIDKIFNLFFLVIALSASPPAFAAEQAAMDFWRAPLIPARRAVNRKPTRHSGKRTIRHMLVQASRHVSGHLGFHRKSDGLT